MVGCESPFQEEPDLDFDRTATGDDLTIISRIWFEPHDCTPRARIIVMPGGRQFTVVGRTAIVELISAEIERRRGELGG